MQTIQLQNVTSLKFRHYPTAYKPTLKTGDEVEVTSDNGRNCCTFVVKRIRHGLDCLIVTAVRARL